MTVLAIGLAIFLGVHSVRVFAEDWRTRTIARIGERWWKLGYSLLSLIGLLLIVWGYGLARADPVLLWQPPRWTRHLAGLLTLPAFVLVAAAYVPRTRLKAWLGHPMLIGVKLWALAHLAANGSAADLLLFGGFLAWAILAFRAARRRDRAAGMRYPDGTIARDAVAIALGLAIWAAFAFSLHAWLIGVRPYA